MNDKELIRNALYEADRLTYSYQCPYLALAEVLGFTSQYQVKYLPSHFNRLSMRKMIMTAGIEPIMAKKIWRHLEDGCTLKAIANSL